MAWRRSKKRACSTLSVRRATNISQSTKQTASACRGRCRSCEKKNSFPVKRRDSLRRLTKQSYVTHHLVYHCWCHCWRNRRVPGTRPAASRVLEIGASRHCWLNRGRFDRTCFLKACSRIFFPSGRLFYVNHLRGTPSVHLAEDACRLV